MAVKSFINENKQYALSVLRGHPFRWKYGRGEVAYYLMAISSENRPFFAFVVSKLSAFFQDAYQMFSDLGVKIKINCLPSNSSRFNISFLYETIKRLLL